MARCCRSPCFPAWGCNRCQAAPSAQPPSFPPRLSPAACWESSGRPPLSSRSSRLSSSLLPASHPGSSVSSFPPAGPRSSRACESLSFTLRGCGWPRPCSCSSHATGAEHGSAGRLALSSRSTSSRRGGASMSMRPGSSSPSRGCPESSASTSAMDGSTGFPPPRAVGAMLAEGLGPKRHAAIEGAGAEPSPCGGRHDGITLTARTSSSAAITVSADCGGYLVFSEPYYPGWEVLVDGKRRPLLRANSAFSAVFLEPGEHRVIRRYRPRSVFIGLLASVSSCALLVVATWRRWYAL